MAKITFYGLSDDIIVFSKDDDTDERKAYGEVICANAVIGGKIRVYAIYDGCWHFSVGQVEERIPFPDWPITIRMGNEDENPNYSMTLEIEVPEGEHHISWC